MVKTKNVGFESGGSASPAPKQPNQRRAVVRLLATFTHGFRRLFALGLLMLILESVTAVFEPYPLAYLIDFLNGKGRTFLSFPGLASHRASTVAVLTLAIVVLAAANSACDSLAELYLARGGRTLGYNIRIALYSHLQKLSLAFHNQRRTGDVLTRVTGDVQAVEEFIVNSLSDLAGSVFLLVGTLGFLFYRSWRVALMALVLVPLLSLVSRYFSKRIKATAKRQRAREGDLASEASEMLSAIRVIQTYGGGGREQQKFADASKKAFGAAVETAGLEAKFSFVVSVMEALITSAVVWLGLLLITHGQLSVGTLVLFVILIQNMFKPTRRIIKEFANIGKTYASVDRIGELLDRQPPVTDLPDAIAAPKLRGEIELRDVSFAYLQDPEDAAPAGQDGPVRLALQHISFRVGPGEVLALVGPSGAGKSTIAQLIPRLYDPQRGGVLIDGSDIRAFTLDSLRSQIGMVLQETILFTGSVAHNIAYGREDATREEIVGAAKMANAHDFITMMPDGYDTELSERAANLSGGQRQRIAIARALIRNAPILMLDEPTTGLDPEASAAVLEGLHRLMSGKTTIIISHDLKLIRSADRIVVIKNGRIDEMGTHDELMARDGLYASLHARQFGEPERVPPVGDERAAEEEEDERGKVFQTLLMQALPVPAQPHALDRAPGVEAAGPGDGARPGDRSVPKVSLRPGEPPQPGPSRRSRTIFKTMGLPAIRRGQPAAPEAPGGRPIHDSLLDARRSPEMLHRFPAIETIFDGAAMGERLQAAMVDGSRYVVERCAVGQALFLGDDECSLRYHIEIKDRATGQVRPSLLSARLFADAARSHLHLRERLTPLANRVRHREATSCFSSLAAALRGLSMTVHAFPIDPDLPQLVEATDPVVMADLLGRTLLGSTVGGAFVPECQVDVAHYPRRYRCVLRYVIRGGGAGVDRSMVVYGKTYAVGQNIPDPDGIRLLREAVLANPRGVRITIPRYAGFVSQMQLLLLEGIPGSPDIGRMIPGLVRGDGGAAASGLNLRQSMVACAATAATLHTSVAALGPVRSLEDDLAQLSAELRMVKRISPDLGARLEEGMASLLQAALRTRAGPLSLAHGDFTYTQALFHGRDVGIVDLDNVCRGEPALDLGQFVAYLRVAVRKASLAASRPHEALSNELCDLFLSSYQDSARMQDTDGLADRVRVYERLSLLRMVVRSWQQLKPARAANALAVLQERSHS